MSTSPTRLAGGPPSPGLTGAAGGWGGLTPCRERLSDMRRYIVCVGAALALVGCGGDGDRSSSNPTSPTPIQVTCKSPITGQPVSLAQWRRDARAWRQSIGNTNTTTVSVDCGDEVVFAPVVTPPVTTP